MANDEWRMTDICQAFASHAVGDKWADRAGSALPGDDSERDAPWDGLRRDGGATWRGFRVPLACRPGGAAPPLGVEKRRGDGSEFIHRQANRLGGRRRGLWS
jgi:hypothetical protein